MSRRQRRREARQEAKRLAAQQQEPQAATSQPVNAQAVNSQPNTDPLRSYTSVGISEPVSLRHIWKGCSAFLVCGGPSLRKLDLGILQARGVVSLGINNVAGYARTDAVTFSDPTQKFHAGILHDPKIIKFVPMPRLGDKVRYKIAARTHADGQADGMTEPARFVFRENTRLRDLPNVWGYDRDCELVPETFLTSPTASWGRNAAGVEKLGGPKIMFTFFLGLRILHYFGVRQVFLLGADFGMDPKLGPGGNYAFNQERTADAIKSNGNIYHTAAHYLRQLKPVFDAAGFRVYNCNPTSQLTVFPYVSFAEASEVCRNGIPEEPLDLSGWYDFKGEGESR